MADEGDGQDHQLDAEFEEEVDEQEDLERGLGAQERNPEGGARGLQERNPEGGAQGGQDKQPGVGAGRQEELVRGAPGAGRQEELVRGAPGAEERNPDGDGQGVQVQITTGLKEYLQKRTNGKIILKEYKKSSDKGLPLRNNVMSLLVREVIGRERNYLLKDVNADQCLDRFVITRERFEILANEICSICTHEHPSVYFTASVKQGEQILVASGKLWNHYNYSKSVLRKANLLKNLKRNGPVNLADAEELEQINESDDINWLSNHLEPWEEVQRKWTNRYAERRSLLLEANMSVYEYIDKFACLKVQRAYELFHIDFKLLYPDKQQITAEQWAKIKPVLIANLASCGVKALDESVLINILKTGELSAEKEDFIILYLLCHLIKPKRNNKRTKEAAENGDPPRKLTFQERRETFILRAEVSNDIRPRLLERYMRGRETFQPVIIAVGEVLRISHYYVVVNDKLFEEKTALKALDLAFRVFFRIVNDKLFEVKTALKAWDLAFRVFFSLDCKYPKNSETIWVFLQQILYNINLQFDNTTLEVKGLIAYIRGL
ncbi:hypothetical protein TSAR_012350 [Trichomalopsis sarcophagae]|uniref:Uncharacterized protein n=1 Tax=Trichomalopsis sarcophagae TaxID=543379 RepID=A0A232F4X9_9HYME|nr:hypothetical protein TSAR_012350 [Trichomalopsis sarcophagae]